MKKAIIIAILLTVSIPAYAFIPKNDFLNEALLTQNAVYLKDKESNRWLLNTDCNLSLRLSDKPEVQIHSRIVREGSRVTIRTEQDTKSCRIESLVKL
jgi:hypothetical protein